MKKEQVEAGATVVVAICAVLVTVVVLRDRLRPAPGTDVPQATETRVEDWREYASAGHRTGSTEAPVTITEFSDFQCPYCAAIEPILHNVMAAHPDDVALVYRHFPLSQIHPFALPAALAAECAGGQGRFWPMHDALFRDQAGLGVRSWSVYAADAGVGDTVAFKRCMDDRETAQRVQEDLNAGTRLGLLGTPTILVNDVLLNGPLDAARLERTVREAKNER